MLYYNIMDDPIFNVSIFQNTDKFRKYNYLLQNQDSKDLVCDLQEVFFSDENIQFIQDSIKKKVYNETKEKYIIPDQKVEHLRQILIGLYHDQAEQLPYNIKGQLDRLNNIVVNYCFPYIIQSINARNLYLRDIDQPRQLNELPVSTSVAGKRTLPSTFII